MTPSFLLGPYHPSEAVCFLLWPSVLGRSLQYSSYPHWLHLLSLYVSKLCHRENRAPEQHQHGSWNDSTQWRFRTCAERKSLPQHWSCGSPGIAFSHFLDRCSSWYPSIAALILQSPQQPELPTGQTPSRVIPLCVYFSVWAQGPTCVKLFIYWTNTHSLSHCFPGWDCRACAPDLLGTHMQIPGPYPRTDEKGSLGSSTQESTFLICSPGNY